MLKTFSRWLFIKTHKDELNKLDIYSIQYFNFWNSDIAPPDVKTLYRGKYAGMKKVIHTLRLYRNVQQ